MSAKGRIGSHERAKTELEDELPIGGPHSAFGATREDSQWDELARHIVAVFSPGRDPRMVVRRTRVTTRGPQRTHLGHSHAPLVERQSDMV